jgi:type I restriction enzyme M protein
MTLLKYCDLHTILRLPEGTFSPYSTGVKANVVFFTKGRPTHEVWIYDLRTNIENINKGNPLDKILFVDFEVNYERKPRKETERFKGFTKLEIEKRDYNLDIFWLKDKFSVNYSDLPDPINLAYETSEHLETALKSVKELIARLSGNS